MQVGMRVSGFVRMDEWKDGFLDGRADGRTDGGGGGTLTGYRMHANMPVSNISGGHVRDEDIRACKCQADAEHVGGHETDNDKHAYMHHA